MESFLVWSAIAVLVSILLWKWATRTRGHANVEDYLDALSIWNWKSTQIIQEDMELLAGGWLAIPEVRFALAELKKRGLAEHRQRKVTRRDLIRYDFNRPIEFRLTEKGCKYREQLKSKQQDSPPQTSVTA